MEVYRLGYSRIACAALGGLLHQMPWKNKNKKGQPMDQDHTAEARYLKTKVGMQHKIMNL